jgi:molybdopterin/thiamine biosynthesis adenylyltransferase
MSLLHYVKGLFGRAAKQPIEVDVKPTQLRVRVASGLWAAIRQHVEDFSHGEEAGFLVCSFARHSDGQVLVAREWHAIPEHALRRGTDGFVLSWSAAFNAQMVQRAGELSAGLVLVHSHGSDPSPSFSTPDVRNAKLFPSISRLLDVPCGTVVLGDHAANGCFWLDGQPVESLSEITVVGAPIERWSQGKSRRAVARRRRDRQTRALGPLSEIALDAASVGVIGCSGGGSHVCQQLAHMGVASIVPVDGEVVEDVNLGRMVGSEASDEGALKVDVMERLIKRIDPSIDVLPVPAHFPSPQVLDALKSVDIVVAAVDSFVVREQVNLFCRRYAVPLIDIGMNINTARERLVSADGQVIAVLPDSPCLRCTPLLSDAVLERERRDRPPGYDRNQNAGDPQVVSMNGTLASEACNIVLDLLTGYANGRRGAGWWQYDGRCGQLDHAELPPRWPNCPTCAEALHADPPPLLD